MGEDVALFAVMVELGVEAAVGEGVGGESGFESFALTSVFCYDGVEVDGGGEPRHFDILAWIFICSEM